MATVSLSVLTCVLILIKLLAGMHSTFNLTTAIYQNVNIKPIGCQDVSTEETISRCTVRALTNYQPFKYLNGECMMCPGDQVTSLVFGGYDFYFPRSHTVFSLQTTYNNEAEIQLSRPLTPGTMIYLSVMPLGQETYFELRSYKPQTTVFHFSVRFNLGRLGFNTWVNGAWGSEDTYMPTDPWAEGQRTDMHLLTTLDRFVVYFNRVYFCDYVYRLPLSDVTSIHYFGDGFVHELGL